MIFWSKTALERSSLAVNEGGSLVYLTASGEASSEFDPYATKEQARQAWEQHTPPASLPVDVHVARYSKLAESMGF
jgi:hypothetical protein